MDHHKYLPSDVTYILSGLSILYSCTISIYSMYLHLRNYRRPDLQRLILRIFWMVPVYSISSFMALSDVRISSSIDTIRDVYEAFVIYSFFTLLINYLDGERNLLLILEERTRIHHLWPFNYFFTPLDMSDPETFLFLRKGVLQFVVTKPILALSILGMKGVGIYNEGEISWTSMYMYTSLLYNISVCWSMYCLVLFYLQCSQDLKPYRPLPKFICVKAIIFMTFWQSLFLAFLGWAGAFGKDSSTMTSLLQQENDPSSPTKETRAALIQEILLCFEMPLFSHLHYYAFPWTDYDDSRLSSRLYLKAAIKDALGMKDFVVDVYRTMFITPRKADRDDSGNLTSQVRKRRMRNMGISFGVDDRIRGYEAVDQDEGDNHEDPFSETRALLPARPPHTAPGSRNTTWKSSSKNQRSRFLSGGTGFRTSYNTISAGSSSSRLADQETTDYETEDSDFLPHQNRPNDPVPTYHDDNDPVAFPDDLDPQEEQDYTIARGLLFGDYYFPVVHEDERFRHPPQVRDALAREYTRFLGRVEEAAAAASSSANSTVRGYSHRQPRSDEEEGIVNAGEDGHDGTTPALNRQQNRSRDVLEYPLESV